MSRSHLTVVFSACFLCSLATASSRLSAQTADPFGGARDSVELTGNIHDAAEQKIKAALRDQTSQSFLEMPLHEAMAAISRTHDIPIVVDKVAIEEIGFDTDVGVNIDLKKVSLRSLLRLMLRDLDLTYVINNQVMQITTKEAAEERLTIEFYRLPENLTRKAPSIVTLLESSVQPDAWEALGGTSVISSLDDLLIVSSNTDVHDQIEVFLHRLVANYGTTLKKAAKRSKSVKPTGEFNDATVQKIRAALDEEASQAFIETPLNEAATAISRTHGIQIVVDYLALQEIGLDRDIGVNIDLQKVSLRSLLVLMLRDLDLSYVIKDDVMQITSRAAAQYNLVTEMYPLPDNLAAKMPQIKKAIESNIHPDTWESLGGTSSLSNLDHVLIVSTTTDAQYQVVVFLNRLVAKYGK